MKYGKRWEAVEGEKKLSHTQKSYLYHEVYFFFFFFGQVLSADESVCLCFRFRAERKLSSDRLKLSASKAK